MIYCYKSSKCLFLSVPQQITTHSTFNQNRIINKKETFNRNSMHVQYNNETCKVSSSG